MLNNQTQGCFPNRVVTQINEKEFILEGISKKQRLVQNLMMVFRII